MVDWHQDPGKGRDTKVYGSEDGFSYHLNNTIVINENRKVLYVRCVNRRSQMCPGTAIIREYADVPAEWEGGQNHICQPDPGAHQERLLRAQILQSCRTEPYQAARQLINRHSANYDPDIGARVRVDNFRSTMRNARNEQYPNIPTTLEDLGETLNDPAFEYLTRTLDNADNMYSGTVGPPGEKCVIFVSRRMKRFMRKRVCRKVYADATFLPTPAAPKGAQVYQIVAMAGRNNVIPLVQVIMQKKTLEAYRAILLHLRAVVPRFRPRLVMCDFEYQHQRAWREVYDCIVRGCYVHFIRAVMKKAGKHGLKRLMNRNCQVKRLIRCHLAIPLLPAGLMRQGFCVLMCSAMAAGVLDRLIEFQFYFASTWLFGWRRETVSVYDEENRTNNACESANRILRLETGPHHPSIWMFLEALKRYEQAASRDARSFELNLDFGRQRRAAVLFNDREIKNLTANLLQGDISIRRFLRRASCRALNVFNMFT